MDQPQQVFLQAFMSHGVLVEADTRQLYSDSVHSDSTETTEDFEHFITSLNRQLKKLDMQVVNARMEDCSERWYGLVNRSADPAAKIATSYTAAQLEFFNKVIETFATNNGVASSTALINAAASLERKLTGSGAQSFLKGLIKSKWLREISRGVYGAGPRFILELRPFLSDIFKEEIVACKICKEPVIMGDDCGNDSCFNKLHPFCVAQYAQGRQSIKCPSCRGDWMTDIADIS